MNYFKLFNLSEDYFIDVTDLSDVYQTKQRQFHPDRFASASDAEKLKALQMATEINSAYQTLKDPIKRAGYLLLLQGIDIQNEMVTLNDNAFLQHQFELRERIDALKANTKGNSEELLINLAILIQEINMEERVLKNDLFIAIENDTWDEAATCLRKLKYYERLLTQVDELEEDSVH
ncbi:Fe-S protein assembly co-chaperone HscB [Thorsellia anophelis]|uniref:Co-chaperone protein HscB n=1 Tax=Thorsellia anophelis DSM 18579 TaxID=1123402 RepID=A0A1I0B4B0_9GAMM|nr:Fe-S protein assembly co-chaperone HscB [Thorsellia anophelis]SET01205.1 molecular chaperone HscB [Thorsellia anophelis DSM 18579]